MKTTIAASFLVFVIAACSTPGPAVAPPPDSAAPAAYAGAEAAARDSADPNSLQVESPQMESVQADTGEDDLVCHREATIGSRIGKRVCRTREQEEEAREEDRRQLQSTIDRSIGAETASSRDQ